jgi:hypothetical protein
MKVLGKKVWILIQHLPRCFFKAEIIFWKMRVDLLHLRPKERLGSRRDETVADQIFQGYSLLVGTGRIYKAG